jgi:hypothetical protein
MARTGLLACTLLAAATLCHGSIDHHRHNDHATRSDRRVAAPVAARNIAGVHYPLKIMPRVDLTEEHRLILMYPTLLARQAHSDEFRATVNLIRYDKRPLHHIFYDFVGRGEFQRNPALADPAGYVTRVFEYWLRRMPSAGELSMWIGRLTPANVTTPTVAKPYTWYGLQEFVAQSSEYAANTDICPTGYYSLGAQVNATSLLMSDLFNGTARLQLMGEAEQLELDIPSAAGLWDQKMPLVANPDCWLSPSSECPKYIAFTRTYRENGNFFMTTLQSNDALNFEEIEMIWQTPGATYYDGHIAVDNSVCPPRYIMTMECAVNGSAASLCTAYTTTPSLPWTWSLPVVIVYGCNPGQSPSCNSSSARGSASTGVTLVDGHDKYMAWTNVVDGAPTAVRTYSQMTGPVADLSAYFGTIVHGTSPIKVMLDAQPGGFCTTSWDCNCRDKQDWKREGDHYYVLFNGANYYRCGGTWGISLARDTAASNGTYTDELPLLRGIPAVTEGSCGISYPVLNVVDGELYVYFAGITTTNEHVAMRSKIVQVWG